MANNKISLNIAGLNILVSTPEDEEYVAQIAKEIDDSVNAILENSSGASVTNAILLCTIDYLDSYKKANRASNNMRNQIKDYMSEAANAKKEFDEERKHSEELVSEIQALRNHLTRIATEGDASGVFAKIRDDLNAANNELSKQRKRNSDLSAQNRALTEKNEAMNSYIAGQDREIARLSAVSEELNTRLLSKTDLIAELSDKLTGYEIRVSELLGETDNLKSQLDSLAKLIDERRTQNENESHNADSHTQSDIPPVIEAVFDAKTSGANPERTKTKPPANLEFIPDDSSSSVLQTDFDDVAPTSDLESDIAEAISLVDEKKISPDGRSMKNYDIDISDLPVTKPIQDSHPSGKDTFDDFDIEEDENIVGFESLRRQTGDEKSSNNSDVRESSNNFGARNTSDVQDTSDNPEPAKNKDTSEADFSERKPKKSALLNEDDDAMPNLSWTLDI